MPDLKLYFSRNLNPRVAVAAAKYMDAPVEYIPASPRHPDHTAAFRSLNPNALVPVLVEDGVSLWEADAITFRLAQLSQPDFWPGHPDAAHITMWVSWSAAHLTPPGGAFYFHRLVRPQFSDEEPSAEFMEGEMRQFREHASTLNDFLTGRDWLVGKGPTYADFRVATVFPFAKDAGLPLAEYREISRWHDQLMQIEAWRDPFLGLAEHPDQIKPLEGVTA